MGEPNGNPERGLLAKLAQALASFVSRPAKELEEGGETPVIPLTFNEGGEVERYGSAFIEPDDPIETDPFYMSVFTDFFDTWDSDGSVGLFQDPFEKWD